MPPECDSQLPGRVRVRWLILIGGLTIFGGVAGYFLLSHQKLQNTLGVLEQARQAETREDWGSAASSYRLYLKRVPSDIDALSAYATVLLEWRAQSPKAIGDALRTLRRLIRLRPDDSGAIEQLVGLYLDLREYALAEQLATNWAEQAPETVSPVIALTRAQCGLYKHREAADGLILAIDRLPGEARLFATLIRLLAENLDRPDEAEVWLAKALRLHPQSHQVQMAAFVFFKRQKDLDAAQGHLRRALALAPDHLDVLVPAARFHISRYQMDQARALLDHATQVAPEDPSLLSARSLWAMRQSDTASMAELADQLLAHAADHDLRLVAHAAELFLRAGELARADECIEKLASVTYSREPINDWLSVLRGGRALLAGSPYAAISHLEKPAIRQRADSWGAEILARAYLQTGQLDAAAEIYGQTLLTLPDAPYARLALAQLELRADRFAEARTQLAALAGTTADVAHAAQLIRIACDLEQFAQEETSTDQITPLRIELEGLVADDPGDRVAVGLMAESLVLAGEQDLALQVFGRALADGVADAAMGAELGRTLGERGLNAALDKLADTLIEHFPDSIEGHLLHVKNVASTDRFSEAAQYIDRSTLGPVPNGRLWEVVSQAHLANRRTNPALEALRRSVELQPESVTTRRTLLRKTPDLAEARRLIEQIRTIEGDDGLHWRYDRSWFLLQRDRSEGGIAEGIELLNHCLAVRPSWIAARLLLAYAHEISENLDEAADAYRSAIAREPDLIDGQVAVRLIRVLRQLGRFAEADSMLGTVADTLKDAPDILRLQTEQYLRGKDLASAAATAEQLLTLRHDDPAWAALTVELQLRAGKIVEAEKNARAALAEHPDSTLILWSCARALIARDESEEAIDLVRQAASDRKSAAHHLLLAQLLLNLDKTQEAEQAIDQALQLEPLNTQICSASSHFWGLRGDRFKQVAFARKAIELRGEEPLESLTLARLLVAGELPGERPEAIAIVERRLGIDPQDLPTLLLKAQLASMADPPDDQEAKRTLRQTLVIDPRSPKAHKLLAAIQIRAGQFGLAGDTVAEGLAFAHKDPDLLLASAQIHCHRGSYRQAITPLRWLMDLTPPTPGVLRLLAAAYQHTGQVDRAIRLMEKQVAQTEGTSAHFVILAKLYELKRDFDRAEALLRQASEQQPGEGDVFQELIHYFVRRQGLDRVFELASTRRREVPEDVESLAVAAEVLAARSHDDELREAGMRWLAEIAELHPEHAADAVFRIARSHYRRGELADAQSKFQEVLKLAPSACRAINALAWLYSEDQKKPADALILIEQYLGEGRTASAELFDTHGTVLTHLGRHREGEGMFRKCRELAGQTSTFTVATYHLGLVLLERGELDEGNVYVRRAIQLDERLGGLTDSDRKRCRTVLSEPRP